MIGHLPTDVTNNKVPHSTQTLGHYKQRVQRSTATGPYQFLVFDGGPGSHGGGNPRLPGLDERLDTHTQTGEREKKSCRVSSCWPERQPTTTHQAPGTRYQATGTRQQATGTRNRVPGTRQQVPGTLYQLPGTSHQLTGTRCKAHCQPQGTGAVRKLEEEVGGCSGGQGFGR